MQRVTIKTSTIFISKGAKTHVYRSMDEVPEPLRRELEESTNGFNSATILIADRRGRSEILRALQGFPSSLRTRLSSSLNSSASEQPEGGKQNPQLVRFLRRHWMEILFPGAVGLLVWAALNFR